MARTPEINQDHIRKAIKYRPRRSYIVRDTMFLKVVSDEVVNVQSYEAVIAQLQVNGNEVVGATIYEAVLRPPGATSSRSIISLRTTTSRRTSSRLARDRSEDFLPHPGRW